MSEFITFFIGRVITILFWLGISYIFINGVVFGINHITRWNYELFTVDEDPWYFAVGAFLFWRKYRYLVTGL